MNSFRQKLIRTFENDDRFLNDSHPLTLSNAFEFETEENNSCDQKLKLHSPAKHQACSK